MVLGVWSAVTVLMVLWLEAVRRGPSDKPPPLTVDDLRVVVDSAMEDHFGPVPDGDEDGVGWSQPLFLVVEDGLLHEVYRQRDVNSARDDLIRVHFEDTDELLRKLRWNKPT